MSDVKNLGCLMEDAETPLETYVALVNKFFNRKHLLKIQQELKTLIEKHVDLPNLVYTKKFNVKNGYDHEGYFVVLVKSSDSDNICISYFPMYGSFEYHLVSEKGDSNSGSFQLDDEGTIEEFVDYLKQC